MKSQQEILSICIPTYNRKEELREYLTAILPQMEAYKDCVSINISDNASTDGTGVMVKEMQQQYGIDIHYFLKEEHTDRYQNIDDVISLTHGKYIFLSGDDDLMAPHLLQTIMPYLLSDIEYGILHWNFIGSDETCRNFIYFRHNSFKEQLLYTPAEFVKTTIASADFISSVIFNRKLAKIKLKEIDGGYRHFIRIIRGALKLNLPCIYYSFPLCVMRNPRRTNDARLPYFLFVEQGKFFKELEAYIPGVYEEFKQGLQNFPEHYLLNMAMDRPFYEDHKQEMLDYFVTPEQKELFEITLTSSNIKRSVRKMTFKNHIKMMRHWMKRKIIGIIHHIGI